MASCFESALRTQAIGQAAVIARSKGQAREFLKHKLPMRIILHGRTLDNRCTVEPE
jgi:hypothetical protein